MGDQLGRERLSFLATRLPSGFETRAILLAPGSTRTFVAAEWCGAIAVIERGEIHLECSSGARYRLGRGSSRR